MSSALHRELSTSARAKPKRVSLGAHRGDCLAVGQGRPVADGSVPHTAVASGAVRSTPSEPVQWFVYALAEGLSLMTATDVPGR